MFFVYRESCKISLRWTLPKEVLGGDGASPYSPHRTSKRLNIKINNQGSLTFICVCVLFFRSGIVTLVSVYREKSSLIEYFAAGALTGAAYKFNMGLRGMTAGFVIGGVLGGIGGCASLLILRLSGMSMEETRYWQYKWKTNRDDAVAESFKVKLRVKVKIIH